MEFLKKYNTIEALASIDIAGIKEIQQGMSGKQYNADLKSRCDSVSGEIAHQIVAKWWGISEDGSFSDTLIYKLACYSATQNAANDASLSNAGAQSSWYFS